MPAPDVESSSLRSVAFRTVGCRLNQCETAQMQDALASAGFRVVDWTQQADVRVVNTCTVTAKSDRTCRHEIHSAKRLDPGCLVVVTGCMAQVTPETLAAMPEVELILGNPDKHALAQHLATCLEARDRRAAKSAGREGPTSIAVSPYAERPEFEVGPFVHFRGRTRAFLKVQTGCDNSCAYCVVPLARGPARSMRTADVLRQVTALAAQGYREIVLTGVDLGSWGRDINEGTLSDLLTSILRVGDETTPVRIRLSSVEPLELDPCLVETVRAAGDRVARHFHIPLQSGSDSVLARMGRPYTTGQYLQVTESLAASMPDAAIGADVIVGFPGESEVDFQATLDLVEASALNYLHVFAYSDRPGTAATLMGPKVPPEVVKERSGILRSSGARKKTAFRDRLVGSEQTALVLEERAEGGRMVGLTGNYLEVLVRQDERLTNQLVRVALDAVRADGRMEATVLDLES